jgi:hypothetical protein
MQYLIPIHKDKHVTKMVWQPIDIPVFNTVDSVQYLEVYTVEQTFIECDICHKPVNTKKEEIERLPDLPLGYALFDNDILFKVVCENCRKERYANTPVFNNLSEAKLSLNSNQEVCGR